MDRMLVVSADGHAGGPPEIYRDYFEARYLPELDELTKVDEEWRAHAITQSRFSKETLDLIDRNDAIRGGGELGAWELDRRLAELDREGVAAEVLIPGHQVAMLPFFSHINVPCSPELRIAGARAYHRQLADFMAESNGRLYGIAEPGPCLNMASTLRELEWLAEHGFVGVAPPGNVADPGLPPLTDASWEPFWSACVDLGLVLTIHAAFGLGQFGDRNREIGNMATDINSEEALRMQMTSEISIDQFPEDHPARLALTVPRRAVWQMMMSGVFDRHPQLQLVLTEVRADWVPAVIALTEAHFADGHAKLARPPRQYWKDQIWMAPSSPRPYEVAMRHEIGVDRFMFGMDYPHPEGTWPNTREWLRDAFDGVPADEARLILGENAVRCYGLDGDRLRAIADKIGPTSDEVLGSSPTNPAVLAQFHARGGYQRPQETVDATFYGRMLA
ncbi:MAG: putative amidohydrolase, partial [Acidimicrobiia bacterium]|nr:putative amidohydrolase [Acidimicrobiia bacterium]